MYVYEARLEHHLLVGIVAVAEVALMAPSRGLSDRGACEGLIQWNMRCDDSMNDAIGRRTTYGWPAPGRGEVAHQRSQGCRAAGPSYRLRRCSPSPGVTGQEIESARVDVEPPPTGNGGGKIQTLVSPLSPRPGPHPPPTSEPTRSRWEY